MKRGRPAAEPGSCFTVSQKFRISLSVVIGSSLLWSIIFARLSVLRSTSQPLTPHRGVSETGDTAVCTKQSARSSFFGTPFCVDGMLRDEVLSREVFDTLLETKVLVERLRREYNHMRPHSSVGYRPPTRRSLSRLVRRYSVRSATPHTYASETNSRSGAKYGGRSLSYVCSGYGEDSASISLGNDRN